MAYVKQTFVDRAVEFARRITMTLVSGTTYDYTPVTGTITNAGTDFTSTIMNKMESGIFDAYYSSLAELPTAGTSSYTWSGDKVTQVNEYESGVLSRKTSYTYDIDDNISSINVKVYFTDGVTILRDWTVSFTFVGGVVTATTRTVAI